MSAEDRRLLGDIISGRPVEPGGAHEDQRLRGQVDVLLVLGDVRGDRLVAELTQLDPHLVGRHPVRAVADDGPITLPGGETLGGLGDGRSLLENPHQSVR